ncbi:unnamed protein product [Rhizopus stolonifer]
MTDIIPSKEHQDGVVPDDMLKAKKSWFTIRVVDQHILFSSEDDDDDDDDDEDYDDFEDEAICACGKKLSAGWNCSVCRNSCSTCHRALLPEEECSRCAGR